MRDCRKRLCANGFNEKRLDWEEPGGVVRRRSLEQAAQCCTGVCAATVHRQNGLDSGSANHLGGNSGPHDQSAFASRNLRWRADGRNDELPQPGVDPLSATDRIRIRLELATADVLEMLARRIAA